MKASNNDCLHEAKSLSVWQFTFKHGVLRLGSEAVVAIWLILALRKVDLSLWEFVIPLVVCPLICFLYAAALWRFQHSKNGDQDV